MDLSCIISDIIQSAVTKGALDVSVTICAEKNTKVIIECDGFSFPMKANHMRSLGYEYIFEGVHSVDGSRLEFISDCPLGKIEKFCTDILSSDTFLKEFRLVYIKGDREYVFSRNETLILLGDVFVGEYNVLMWIEEEIKTKTEAL